MTGRKPAATQPEPEPTGFLAIDVDANTGIGRENLLAALVEFQTPDPVDPENPTDGRALPPHVEYKHNGTVLEWPTLSKKTGKFLVRSIFYGRQLPVTLYPDSEYERKVVALHRAIRGDVVVLDLDDATQSAVDGGYLEPFKE